MLVGPKKVFGPYPTPKIAPKGPKRFKKAPNGVQLRIDRYGCNSTNRMDNLLQ